MISTQTMLVLLLVWLGAITSAHASVPSVSHEWRQTIEIFTTIFIGSGTLLGVSYILVSRALKINRAKVEEWLEQQRLRLEKGPIPLIEKAQPIMAGALGAIYGFGPRRRFFTSLTIGTVFMVVGLGLAWQRYYRLDPEVRATKLKVEIAADPKLYQYFTDPSLRPTYDAAFKMIGRQSRDTIVTDYANNDAISLELRDRFEKFNATLTRNLTTRVDKVPLTLLMLFEGTYLRPGMRWGSLLPLFAFNVLLDFVSVTLVAASLAWLGKRPSFRNGVLAFLTAGSGVVILAWIALMSYSVFFRGNLGFFWQFLIIFPLSLVGLIGTITGLLSVTFWHRRGHDTHPIHTLFLFLFIGSLSWFGLNHVWAFWSSISLKFQNWQELVSFPYALAGATLLPAVIVLLVLLLLLLLKATIEPARLLQWASMTYGKEEAGASHAAGLIAMASAILAALISLTLDGSPTPKTNETTSPLQQEMSPDAKLDEKQRNQE